MKFYNLSRETSLSTELGIEILFWNKNEYVVSNKLRNIRHAFNGIHL